MEREYGVRAVSLPSVQSASVYGAAAELARDGRTAAIEEVIAMRSTPASSAARTTRSAPSRAGTISSSGSLGCTAGNGEATWST